MSQPRDSDFGGRHAQRDEPTPPKPQRRLLVAAKRCQKGGMIPLRLSMLGGAFLLCGAGPELSFSPAGPPFIDGAEQYAQIWKEDGEHILASFEAMTGLAFPEGAIEAIVSDTRPMMSFDGRSMRLRAGYSDDYKRATLVHELGHRLAFTLPRNHGLDDHRLLYLFLYDVWSDLYGQSFADRMVRIERRIPGPYDYDAAWRWALGQSFEERQERLRALRQETLPSLGS